MDRAALVMGAPLWFWALMVPFSAFMLTLGWIAVMLRQSRLETFCVSGLGLSIQIRTGASHTRTGDSPSGKEPT